MPITANKGEWSELYVLFKLLGEKKLYAGDGDLNRLEAFYPVLKIIRDELERHLEYNIQCDIIVITENGEEFARINTRDFVDFSQRLFGSIQQGSTGNGAFEIPWINGFLQQIRCQKVKAKSMDKSDIHIVIHDYHTGMNPNLGFSIKSEAGNSATILNASPATVIRYKINGDSCSDAFADVINNITSKCKVQDRVISINNQHLTLNYYEMENRTFANNLQMIDSHLPEIIAWMMADAYNNRDMDLERAVQRITKANPMGYDLSEGHDYYGYKIKSLLVATALGMVPATTWTGRYDATGGYIIVKDDGDVICFHIFDRNLLEDYLLKNSKFETPTGKRYNLARMYKNERNDFFFNLVLQIRFK